MFEPRRFNWNPEGDQNRAEASVNDETEKNLLAALRQLETELLQAGVVSVSTEVEGYAKSVDPGLRINIGSGINSVALIKLIFKYGDGKSKEIFVEGWKNSGDHLSGAATVESFVTRVRDRLKDARPVSEVVTMEPDVPAVNWDNWGEEFSKILGAEIVTAQYLLGDYPALDVRKKPSDDMDAIKYEVFVKSHPNRIVVKFSLEAMFFGSDGVAKKDAEKFKQRVIKAIKKAGTTGQTELA
ncbi:MAG TPA: hypothetical protein DEP87_02865 [Candidatus Pacebacteria bacterium]|nr:hypothetical protein [Candidatus Paceibacterota bacterium]